MWLRAQATNKKIEIGMQVFFCVKYDTVRGYISTIILLVKEGGLKRKLLGISRRLHLVRFFAAASNFTCIYKSYGG